MENNEKLLIGSKEACELLNIGMNTLLKLVKEGKLPVIKWNRKILIPRAALEKMLAETGAKVA